MRSTDVLRLVVLVTACGKSDPPAPPPAPAPEPKPIDAAPAKPERVLPAEGMLCFEGNDAWVWTADGKIASLDAHPVASADGSLWNRDSGEGAGNPPDVLVSLARPPAAPPLPLKHAFGEVWRSASGAVLDVADDDVQVWRKGAWTKLQTPGPFKRVDAKVVVEYRDAWWIETFDKVFREDKGALVEVSLDSEGYDTRYPSGLVQTGDQLSVLFAIHKYAGDPLFIAPIVDGKLQKPKQVGTVITTPPTSPHVATNPAGNWAAFAEGGVYGTIYASIGGVIAEVTRRALGFLAIDGYDRIWYVSEAGFVAHAPDGGEQVYPRASHAMFQKREWARCLVIGKGFAQLPAGGGAQTGTLVLDVSGGAKLPFAVCDELLGRQRCEDNPKKIAGTLDDAGTWTGQVPIGTYQATVQVNGAWLVADLSHGAGGGSWLCTVKAGERCTIKLSTR